MVTMTELPPKKDEPSRPGCLHMESVNRVMHLPVVDATIQAATNLYGKVKEFNGITHWTLSTAESTVHKVIECGKPLASPIAQKLDGPIKKVDGYLCSGLNFVEEKIPAVKLPPGEMYNNTKQFVANNPTIQGAKRVVEPAVERAKTVVEPYVQSAREAFLMDKREKEDENSGEEGEDCKAESQQTKFQR